MNEIINKFLLAGDKFMLEMHLKQSGLLIVLANLLLKIKNEYKKLKKHEIQNIFIKKKMLLFKMTWLIEILNINIK